MDILTFIAKVLDSLVWPFVVVATLYLFRVPFSSLLDSLKNATFKWKRGDSAFEGRLETVRENLEQMSEKPSLKQAPHKPVASPQRAIENSWRELQTTAVSTLSAPPQLSPLKLANMLVEKKVLNEKEADAFYRLYELRNDALNPRAGIITDVSSGSAYSSVASSLANEIKNRGA